MAAELLGSPLPCNYTLETHTQSTRPLAQPFHTKKIAERVKKKKKT